MNSRILGLLALGLMAVPVAAGAAPVTYVGADNNVSSLAQMLNSQAAAASFDAAAPGLGMIDFESGLPAGVSISGGSTTNSSGCGKNCGFNTTLGGQFFRLLVGNSATFSFASPINAFGMYITGLQTDIVVGQKITYTDGSIVETILTPGAINGGGAFMGFIDVGKLVTSVTYDAQAPNVGDIVALDDARFGTAGVPEPATFALLGLGLVGLGVSRRRKS